jgi:hypothetical protein
VTRFLPDNPRNEDPEVSEMEAGIAPQNLKKVLSITGKQAKQLVNWRS